MVSFMNPDGAGPTGYRTRHSDEVRVIPVLPPLLRCGVFGGSTTNGSPGDCSESGGPDDGVAGHTIGGPDASTCAYGVDFKPNGPGASARRTTSVFGVCAFHSAPDSLRR